MKHIHDEIRSWDYESPPQLMTQVADLLREVLNSGGRRDDLDDFRLLYDSLTKYSIGTLEDILHTLGVWNDQTDSGQLNDPDSDDRMLKFKVGVVWVVSRSLMLFFNPNERPDTFAEWQDFTCRNIERMLGIYLAS